MSRVPLIGDPPPAVSTAVSRPTQLDYFLLLAGCALSFYLIRLGHPLGELGATPPKEAVRYIGHLKVEPGPPTQNSPALRYLVLTLPDLLRLPEGIILLWPILHSLQRLLGRRQGLTSGEWLWVFSWLGTALLTGLAAWGHWGGLPEFLANQASWPYVIWYVILVPSMALIAVLVMCFGVLGRWQLPWTHNLGLALIIWPAVPLTAILTLGKYALVLVGLTLCRASVLGLDIGGANLKAAHSNGAARLRPFELWKDPAGLPAALRALIEQMPAFDLLAVTMTGELCDCFETKRQGVDVILNAVLAAAGRTPLLVWQTDGRLVDIAEARTAPLLAAASNWLALATFAGRHAPQGTALLVDVGSTTTDIIPLQDGRPAPSGRTDFERLRSGELVYTGIRRTPVCALVQDEVAAEVFATTLDAYLVLDHLPEEPSNHHTADGRPATRVHAHARLARMLGADRETCTEEQTHGLARWVMREQIIRLRWGLRQVLAVLREQPAAVILAGAGEFLARMAVNLEMPFAGLRLLSLSRELRPAVSAAACAYALAVLAAEQG